MMKLKDIMLEKSNHFVAMEYYALILNRTYLILLTHSHLVGIVANGLVSVRGGVRGSLADQITTKMAIEGDLNNPLSYLNENYLQRINQLDLLGEEFLRTNRSNFRIKLEDVASVRYDSRKKWGMGYYPHDGKVYVETQGKIREFVVLGDQSGADIARWIQSGKLAANKSPSSDALTRAG